jgi:class 3 adenylate cyclase
VGDTVNMVQRLCDLARPGRCTVVSEATWAALPDRPAGTHLDEVLVKGRETPVTAWMLGPALEAEPALLAGHGGSR